MADDKEDQSNDNEEESESGLSSGFSKVKGMISSGEDGEDGKDGEDGEDGKDKEDKVKAKPTSLFDIDALKEFGFNILTLFVETVIISIICVNILFFSNPQSISGNELNLPSLFPTDRHKWPYCYTNEYTECDVTCDDKFGDIANDSKNSSVKKIYLKAAILLDTFVFKWFCLTKENIEQVKEDVDEGVTKVNLLNWDFIKIRFKQWVNNSFIFSFSTSRLLLLFVLNYITKISNAIPKELYDVVSPLLILLMPFVFLLFVFYLVSGGPAFMTIIGMIINRTDNGYEFIGGSLWTLLTGAGFMGVLPFIVYVIQVIQYMGTFLIYPFLHMDQYRNLFSKYVPIIFFFFNLMVMLYAFEGLDLNVAAIVILVLFTLYLTTYWEGIMDFFNKVKNYGS
jgi:hypothetical protein